MDYSTFTNKKFFIKQNSTLPEIKYGLTQFIRDKYDITDEMLENVAVTFSMIDTETGIYRIANVEAKLVKVNTDERLDEAKYYLAYRFKLPQTKKPGNYQGEFVVDFLGDYCGKITLPTDDTIEIFISPSITKTTVV